MNSRIQIIAITLSVAFLVAVLELVRRRKLVEEYSFIWIAIALGILAVSIWREFLHAAARGVGIYEPPNVLLLALTGGVVRGPWGFSVILSRQRRQIDRLIEDVSILTAELREQRSGQDAVDRSSLPNRPAK